MSKLIVIAGIKRSGSTWMYNVVRILLTHAGFTVTGGGRETYKKNCEKDYQIIKVHPYYADLAKEADLVFTSDRDDEEIRASWARFQNRYLTDAELWNWCRDLDRWMKHRSYHMPFERVNKTQTVKDIAKVLGVHVTTSALTTIGELKPPKTKGYDPKTLMFKNHITSK